MNKFIGFMVARHEEGMEILLKLAKRLQSQMGFAGVKAIIEVILGVVVLGTLVYALWPQTYTITSNITALSGTDAGTVTIKAIWPVVVIIAGLALCIGVLMYVLDKAGLI